jgi:hypothetical protein
MTKVLTEVVVLAKLMKDCLKEELNGLRRHGRRPESRRCLARGLNVIITSEPQTFHHMEPAAGIEYSLFREPKKFCYRNIMKFGREW